MSVVDYTLNNIGSLEQCNPRTALALHGDSTEGFFLKNLYCLECNIKLSS